MTFYSRLQRVLDFSTDDLLANQQGSLTEHQRAIARAKYRQFVRNGLLGLLAFWLVFVVIVILSVSAKGTQPQDKQALVYVLLAITVIFSLICLISVRQGRDLRAGRVASVEGQAKTQFVRYRTRYSSSTGYEVLIGRQKFRLNSEADLAAFENGARYRVYYIPYPPLHVPLSAEPLAVPSL